MKLDRREIDRLVAAGDLGRYRLVLLHGPDEPRSRSLAAGLLAALGRGGEPTVVALTPAELKDDPGRLAGEAASLSMFGDRTIVRVDGAGDESLAAIEALLAAPAVSNPVVVVTGDLGKAKLRSLGESSPLVAAHASYQPKPGDAAREAQTMADRLGVRIDRDLAAQLVEAAGGDLGILTRELEKLALYLDSAPDHPQPLAPDDLAAVGANVDEGGFDALVDAVAAGRPEIASDQLRRLGTEGAGISALRAVGRRLALLLELRLAMERGNSVDAAIAAHRPPVFWKDRPAVAAQLGQWRVRGLRAAQRRLLDAERDIKKSGSAGDVLAAQALLGISVQASRRAESL